MIFADASFFIAVANRNDRWHRDALNLMKTLREGLIVSDFVIAESVAHLGGRVGVQAGMKLFQYFSDDCTIRFADEELLSSALRRWMTFGGKLSVSDAVSLEIMAREGITEILSFDSDFDGIRGIERRC